MKILAVKQPWAEEIIAGRKIIEVRSRNTNIRERVAIYATRTKPKTQDLEWLTFRDEQHEHERIRGFIIGTVEIHDSRSVRDANHFHTNLDNHLCYQDMYKKGQHFWYLRNAQRITPIPHKMKRGTVVWDAIDDKLINEASLK